MDVRSAAEPREELTQDLRRPQKFVRQRVDLDAKRRELIRWRFRSPIVGHRRFGHQRAQPIIEVSWRKQIDQGPHPRARRFVD